MKVGIICDLMTGYGGVQTCVLTLVKGLNSYNIKPDLLHAGHVNEKLFEDNKLLIGFKKIKYSIRLSTYMKYYKYLKYISEFVYFIKTTQIQNKYDFIYIFQPHVIVDNNQKHLFYLSMSPRAHNFSKNKILSKFKNIFYKFVWKHYCPISEHQNYNCVINSKYTNNYFRNYYGKSLKVVYPSNSVDHISNDNIIKKKNTVLFFSRITKDKRPDIIVELAKRNKNIVFTIAGAVNEKEEKYLKLLENTITENNLNNISIITNLPFSNYIEILKQSEYYIFCAENEHFGITTVEAIHFGCIPFVHDSGGQKEIVPFDNLRFNYSNVHNKFASLLKINEDEKENIKKLLIKNNTRFSNDNYIKQMLYYIGIEKK